MMGESININNVAASFQQAVIEVLVTKPSRVQKMELIKLH